MMSMAEAAGRSQCSKAHYRPSSTRAMPGRNRSILGSALFLCGMVFVLAACETTGSTPGAVEYNMFFSPADHLSELTAVGKIDEAGKVYEDKREFFDTESKKRLAVVGAYWTAFQAKHGAEIERADQAIRTLEWPAGPDHWVKTRQNLAETAGVIDRVDAHLIVIEKRFPFKALKDLKDALASSKKKIQGDAAGIFATYQLASAPKFFGAYPVTLDAGSVVAETAEALSKRFESASADDLVQIHGTYRSELSDDLKHAMGRRYFDLARQRQTSADPNGLKGIVTAALKTRESGLPLKQISGVKLAMIEITSKTLLKEGQIEFPISVDLDLPVQAEKADLDTAFSGEQAQAADHLIIIDVALAKASRRVLNIDKVRSTVLTGYRDDPNPEYNVVQNEVINARMVAQQAAFATTSAGSQFCQGLGCLGKLIATAIARGRQTTAGKKLQETMTKLTQTSQTLNTPIFQDYKFDAASVKANKTATVNYYIVDRIRKKYFKSTFDIVEDKSFRVAYNVSDRDPKNKEHITANDTEADVAEWEEAASPVKLTQLAQHYFDNAEQEKDLPSLEAIRGEMLADKNVALAKFQAEQFKARPVEDPRLKHVVVVFTAGSQGSGFFVKPDVVLTNWHVVENQKFIELKMHGGQETFGKVVAKDVRLDLALIKVQQRGLPVQFYGNNKIALGQTVEAIGHPKGLEFSVTRGVISAVRTHPSINLPTGAGKEVLYIQTDAPINRGNSGGPLFLGDKVVGVNTWKRHDIATSSSGSAINLGEGLNFAAHYTEVTRFLKDYLPSFRTGGS